MRSDVVARDEGVEGIGEGHADAIPSYGRRWMDVVGRVEEREYVR